MLFCVVFELELGDTMLYNVVHNIKNLPIESVVTQLVIAYIS